MQQQRQHATTNQDEFEEVEGESLEVESASSPRPECIPTSPSQPPGVSVAAYTEETSHLAAVSSTEISELKEDDKVSSATSRQRSHTKVKLLVRSHAMREETSPPPDPDIVATTPTPTPNSLSVSAPSMGRPSSRHRLRHQGSSQGSLDSSSPCLSRDSSTEQPFTDNTGIDLQQFILETLNRNQKDRMLLLKIEQELTNLVKDKKAHHKFPQMSSYQRMLVHRVAAFFGMDHNVDQSGNAVIVNKTKNTRLPDIKFRDYIRDELLPEEPKKSILKRDSSSFEEGSNLKSSSSQEGATDSPLRSHESTHNSSRRSSQEELRWCSEVHPWSSSDSDTSACRGRILPLPLPVESQLRPTRLLKVESFESRDTLKANSLRPSVSKSYSFGGYTAGVSVLARGDSVTSTHSAGARLFTKQDSSGSSVSRLSPSSSGYKSQSLRSDTLSATPSPTPTVPGSQTSLTAGTPSQQQAISPTQPSPWTSAPPELGSSQTVMWAVTNMDAVPPGSVLINPQSGQPYLNSDGSVYRYDPANPPKILSSRAASASSSGGSSEDSPAQASVKAASPPPPPHVQETPAPPPITPTQHSTAILPVPPHFLQLTTEASQTQHVGTPVLYTTYSVSNEHRGQQIPPESNIALADLTSYFMGMSLTAGIVPDQGGGGDTGQPPGQSLPQVPHPAAPPTPVAAAPAPLPPGYVYTTGYWPNHSQAGTVQQVPLYYMSTPAGGVGSPSQPTASAPRFVYPPFIHTPATGTPPNLPPSHSVTPHPSAPAVQSAHSVGAPLSVPADRHQTAVHSAGQYMPSYPVMTYASPMMATGGDCVYAGPAQQTIFTPTSMTMPSLGSCQTTMSPTYTAAGTVPFYQPNVGLTQMVPYPPTLSTQNPQQQSVSYRAATPPQTPSSQGLSVGALQGQSLCNVAGHPLLLMNGSYGIYNPTGGSRGSQGNVPPPQSIPHSGTIPTPVPQITPQYVAPNLGIYRTNVQVVSAVRSGTPPPPRGSSVPVPLVRSASSGGRELRVKPSDRHEESDKSVSYTSTSAGVSLRYPHIPYYGIRLVPGDLRLVAPGLQTSPAVRVPFVLPQPLLTNPAPGLPSSLETQSTCGRPPKLRKQRSKTSSRGRDSMSSLTPQASLDIPDTGNCLEVHSLPPGLTRVEVERHLEELHQMGGSVVCCQGEQWLPLLTLPPDSIVSGKMSLRATFMSEAAAQNALAVSCTPKFSLRPLVSSHPPS